MKLEQHSIESQLYDNKVKQRDAEITLASHQDQLDTATQQSQTQTGKAAKLQADLARAQADFGAAEQADAATGDDRTALTTLVADAARQAGGADVTAQLTAASDALAKLIGGA